MDDTTQGTFDFVVVGTGAAGLLGAITASLRGLRPIVIEKADRWGGTTATSGGVLWIPNNDLMRKQGASDSPEAARDYLRALIGEDADDRVAAKAEAFLENAPDMARMLAKLGLRWFRTTDHPDYYPGMPGSGVGRTIESAMVDGATLGPRFSTMRYAEVDMPAIHSGQFGSLTRAKTSLPLMLEGAKTVALHAVRKLMGKKPLGNGRALAAALMKIVDERGIPVRLSTRLVELVVEDGRVTGVIAESEGRRERLDAPAGVLLAAGGFAQNAALRRELQGRDRTWSNAIAEDTGDALQVAMAAGASTELTDDCWWMPTIQVNEHRNGLALGLRALPGSIVVNGKGERYMNEARSYMTTGRVMHEHGAAGERHWLVMDGHFLKRYIFAELSDKAVRAEMEANGYLVQADTLGELAARCGLDPAALEATVARFNGFARTGRDEDFGRGETAYDRYWADPGHRPNPSLGEIARPPFWAAVIRPGDLGTNGGLRTDRHARVLDAADRPIEGLYAAGNGSGSPFGRTYPGAGATIAAAATFGYLAARHAAQRRSNAPD
ncbi:FAD-binding protein [Croceicoccus sp. BE223]|uniref:FAD-binding protein n=1 Tax=Croceicoccus sp. BE223 TaxID=2817716 RepID=UPI00286239BF|nr:FAD-binding protein [Croceicoccus sp. BE223]MDR7101762.1 3-oxosteroid 1-dehydrogenase [Croceicoccus sp. BE223]